MKTPDKIKAILERPLSPEESETDEKNLTYPTAEACKNRLDEAFGIGNWGWEINEAGYLPELDCHFVTGHLQLPSGVRIGASAGQQTNRYSDTHKKAGQPIDPGNDRKGAGTYAFRKACWTLGIGLYLSNKRKNNGKTIYNQQRQEQKKQSSAPAPDPKKVFDEAAQRLKVDPDNYDPYFEKYIGNSVRKNWTPQQWTKAAQVLEKAVEKQQQRNLKIA